MPALELVAEHAEPAKLRAFYVALALELTKHRERSRTGRRAVCKAVWGCFAFLELDSTYMMGYHRVFRRSMEVP